MTESRPTPAVDVTVSEVVRRPVEAVAAYANDPSHAPEWYANIAAATWRTPPPVRVGSQIAFTARFLGRELRYTYSVTELTRRSLVMRTAEGPFPMETSYGYHQLSADSTRVTLRNRGTPTGFSALAAPVMRIAMRRAMTKDLRALRRILEA